MNNLFKKISAFTLGLFIILSIFAILPFALNAERQYVPLESGAFGGAGFTGSKNMGDFLGTVFKFGISIAAGLAVFMIAWGGVQYMTTDAWFEKDEAKSKIQNAVLGLLLALSSWLILHIINPAIFSPNNLFIKG